MTFTLSQRQRLIVAGLYLGVLWLISLWVRQQSPGSDAHALFWLYTGALLIVLGKYVVEPFYTTPADAIVNALALLISLQSLSSEDQGLLPGYQCLRYYAFGVLALGCICIGTKDSVHQSVKISSRVAYKLVEYSGKSQIMFSVVYLLASWAFFARHDTIGIYVSALALWICVTFFDVFGKAIHEITKLVRWANSGLGDELGSAIGCENPLLYRVEVDHGRFRGRIPRHGDLVAIETQTNTGSVGMVVDRKQLLGKSWLSVYLLVNDLGEIIKLNLRAKKLVEDPQSVFAAANRVFAVDMGTDLSEEDSARVKGNPLFAYKTSFVGYVTRDSNINTVNFIVLRARDATAREISEGVILKTTIYSEDTLYQVINGNTREEHLQGFDSHGYTVGVARKLGRYLPAAHELETRKWMPNIYAPLFFGFDGTVSDARVSEIAQSSIGRLPQTDLEIRIKDLDAIVTHNTAILGILGIGKSCLSFELIRKVVAAGVKVICIDITNQYNTAEGLPAYVGPDAVSFDLPTPVTVALKTSKDSATKLIEGNPQSSGNSAEYREKLDADLTLFLGSDTPIKIYNPDLHPVSKGVAFKNTSLEDLTVAEKTRVIAERLFLYARRAGESPTAKYLLVLEEAHSLVPEWNSVANDGDKNATNGTAKVILQGRKYGLGSLTITQRTANVSKSILNQCNTIFAMRVFDDTGKSFLANYIGTDYADTLPTLEERHAIAIGRGLKLKQPVIIQLNDRREFVQVAPAAVDPAPALAPTPEA